MYVYLQLFYTIMHMFAISFQINKIIIYHDYAIK